MNEHEGEIIKMMPLKRGRTSGLFVKDLRK